MKFSFKIIYVFCIAILLVLGCERSKNPYSYEYPQKNPVEYAPVTFNSRGWAVIQSFPYNYQYLRIIEAADARVAWVSDWRLDKIFKTENGGASWKELNLPRIYFSTIEAVDSLTLYVGTEGGAIIKSTDGGTNWTIPFEDSNVTGFINYIEFFDPLNGVAMGDGVMETGSIALLRTTDGGNSWVNQNNSVNGVTYIRSVSFYDLNYGFLDVSLTGLHWTTNGGQAWLNIPDPGFGNVRALTILDSVSGICSFTSRLSRTTDRGISWSPLNLPQGYISPLAYAKTGNDPTHLWAISNSLISTANSGNTWKAINTGFASYYGISSPTMDVVWASGYNGHVTYTTRADTLY